jgi:hypothetical protein
MSLLRGADGTKEATQTVPGVDAGSTALDIARTHAGANADFRETLAVLCLRCCSTCGVTSAGLSGTTPGGAQRLKRCASCPAGGPVAHYCGVKCQRADWVARHKGQCTEARHARQAAGTQA